MVKTCTLKLNSTLCLLEVEQIKFFISFLKIKIHVIGRRHPSNQFFRFVELNSLQDSRNSKIGAPI